MGSQRRRGILLGYANMAIRNVVNLLYTPMLLAFVGKADYGVFQTANSFVFSLTLLSFGFSGAYVRFYTQRKVSGDEDAIRTLNGMYLILYLTICTVVVLVGLLCSENVEAVFSKSFTLDELLLIRSLVRIMSFNVAVTLLSTVFDAYIIVHEQFTFQQTRQMLTTLLTPVLALLLLFAGARTVGVAVAQLVVSLILLLLNIRYSIVRLNMRFSLSCFDVELLRALIAFSAWLFANQICDLVNQNVPNVVLGAECGAAVVAVFAVSIQIRNVFVSLSTIFSNVFIPEVNRVVMESNDSKKLTDIMTRVGRYQMALLLWVYCGFVILGRFFVGRWAGDGFADSYWMTVCMLPPLLVPLSQNVGIEIQKAKNMHKARSIAYLVMAVVAVMFTVFTAPYLGYWSAAIAYISSIIIGNCVFMNYYYHVRVGLDMMVYWSAVLPIVVSATIVTMACLIGTRFVPVINWYYFFIWGVCFSLLYACAFWLFASRVDERLAVRMRLKRFFRKETND